MHVAVLVLSGRMFYQSVGFRNAGSDAKTKTYIYGTCMYICIARYREVFTSSALRLVIITKNTCISSVFYLHTPILHTKKRCAKCVHCTHIHKLLYKLLSTQARTQIKCTTVCTRTFIVHSRYKFNELCAYSHTKCDIFSIIPELCGNK